MVTTRALKSIYIHIPFCKTKCNYCNFISFAQKDDFIRKYFNALEKEIAQSMTCFEQVFNTVYIGGGTPSTIETGYYEKILPLINKAENAEVTIEVNPGTVTLSYLKELKALSFNRLSIGVQNFDDNILKTLNRLHTAQEAVNTVNMAKAAGFSNISIDLIYGLPGQTLYNWEQTLYRAIDLSLEHISAYGLKIEEDTEFARNLPQNLPDDDETAKMYLKTIEILEQKGFQHYEISNFSKPGFESRHNLAYWNNEEYFGFGLGAHGYIKGVRYSNVENLQQYIQNPLAKASEKKLSQQEMDEETVFLGLRLRKGINVDEFFIKRFIHIIKKYSSLGMLKLEENILTLTPRGVLLSNNILAEFL